MSYVPLKGFKDYEIQNKYPFTIRKKSNKFIVKDCKHPQGYVRVWLDGNYYLKHVLIAKQFLHNDDPEHNTEVDHKNRDRGDNHLSNLRWVSHSVNGINRVLPKK